MAFETKYDHNFVNKVHWYRSKDMPKASIAKKMGVSERAIKYIIRKRKPSAPIDAVVENFHDEDVKITIWQRVKEIFGVFYKKK